MEAGTFSRTTYASRVSRLLETMANSGVDAVVLSPSSDLLYLCGYDALALERPTLLVITEGRHPTLFVPRLERLRVPEVTTSLAEVVCWDERDEPYEAVAAAIGRARTVAVGDQMWAMHFVELAKRLSNPIICKASEVIGPLRARKDSAELRLLRKAACLADKVASRLGEIVEAGVAEKEIALRITSALLDVGNDSVGFVIVASGPNSASPHHEPTGRTISNGDIVVCDFGGVVRHYRSDITRVVVVGDPPTRFEATYETVRTAQQLAVEAARAGTKAGDVDRVARDWISGDGYGDQFIHRTGHGIGLDPHEPPYIAQGSEERIAESMCFSIEPGIYKEGEWGIRIEDIVVTTKEGGVRLNDAARDPIYV